MTMGLPEIVLILFSIFVFVFMGVIAMIVLRRIKNNKSRYVSMWD